MTHTSGSVRGRFLSSQQAGHEEGVIGTLLRAVRLIPQGRAALEGVCGIR